MGRRRYQLSGYGAETISGLQLINAGAHRWFSLCGVGEARCVLFSGDHLWWTLSCRYWCAPAVLLVEF